MNKWTGMGRLTKDPEVRYSTGNKPTCVARYTLAVNRKFKQDGQPNADFISCICFGKQGEFAEKYLKQGIKIVVSGRIQTGSYNNREGQKIYTTDVVVEEQEFAESKAANEHASAPSQPQTAEPQQMSFPTEPEPPKQKSPEQPWMSIPDGLENELPFL